jgi:hypothetical protein
MVSAALPTIVAHNSSLKLHRLVKLTYQGSHGAVQSMSVVSSELGVGSLERRVSVGLGLLDTAQDHIVSLFPLCRCPSCLMISPDALLLDYNDFGVVVNLRNRFHVPVTVRLARLVVLRRVLGF